MLETTSLLENFQVAIILASTLQKAKQDSFQKKPTFESKTHRHQNKMYLIFNNKI